MSDDYVCVPHRIVNCPIPTCEDQFNVPYKEVESLKQQVEKLHACLSKLFNAAPSLGHHDVPDHDCPARELAQAMNEASKLLGVPVRYPKVTEEPKVDANPWAPNKDYPSKAIEKQVCEKCGGDHLPALTCQERRGRCEW